MTLIVLMFLSGQALAIPLQQAYDEALPGAGYDRLIVLDPAETYTGGLRLADETVCILSCGALIDLQGGTIGVEPSAKLDICGVILTGSADKAVSFESGGRGWIDHCTFAGNYDGVWFDSGSNLTLTSNIFVYSSHIGVSCDENVTRWLAYNDAWANAEGDYEEWCAG